MNLNYITIAKVRMKRLLIVSCTLLFCLDVALANSGFYRITMVTPSDHRAYLVPAETMVVEATVEPSPTPLHTLLIKLDDKVLATNQTKVSIPTIGQDTGVHRLIVELQDETGHVVSHYSTTVSFVPKTLIMKKRQEMARAKAEYEALPWYKKLITIKPVDEPESMLNFNMPTAGLSSPQVGLVSPVATSDTQSR